MKDYISNLITEKYKNLHETVGIDNKLRRKALDDAKKYDYKGEKLSDASKKFDKDRMDKLHKRVHKANQGDDAEEKTNARQTRKFYQNMKTDDFVANTAGRLVQKKKREQNK